jgi:hypothetical protein
MAPTLNWFSIELCNKAHFTLNNPDAPAIPAFEYNKYELKENGQALLKTTLLGAIDYSKIKEYQIQCELGKGLAIFDDN